MTAANVASTQQGIGRTGSPGVVTALALAVALLAGVAIGAFAVRATTTTTHVAPAAVARRGRHRREPPDGELQAARRKPRRGPEGPRLPFDLSHRSRARRGADAG